MRKPKTIWAVWDGESELYVELKYCGIHPLIPFIDGLPIRVECGKNGKTYIAASVALEWHRREYEQAGRAENKKCADLIEEAILKHSRGESTSNCR